MNGIFREREGYIRQSANTNTRGTILLLERGVWKSVVVRLEDTML